MNSAISNQYSQKSNNSNKSHKSVLILITIIILLIIVSTGIYYFQNKKVTKLNVTISELNKKVEDIQKKLDNTKIAKTDQTPSTSSVIQSKSPTPATIENIEAAITSGNTAALEGYMSPSINVVIAASEFSAQRTPSQAINDLNYLNKATAPWNFDVDKTTFIKFTQGDYKAYFNSTTLLGISANKMVVAFNFNDSAKISGIFMSANSDLL